MVRLNAGYELPKIALCYWLGPTSQGANRMLFDASVSLFKGLEKVTILICLIKMNVSYKQENLCLQNASRF